MLGLPPLFAVTYAAGCFAGYSIATAAAADREGAEGSGIGGKFFVQVDRPARGDPLTAQRVPAWTHRQRQVTVKAQRQPASAWQVPSAQRVTTKLKALGNMEQSSVPGWN
jgi:hypothetical protein